MFSRLGNSTVGVSSTKRYRLDRNCTVREKIVFS